MRAAVRVRLEGSLIDHVALQGGSIHVEGIAGSKMHFNRAAEILHDVNAAAQKTSIKEDISGRGLHAHAVKRWVNHLDVAADRVGFQLARAASAEQRAVDRLDNHVAVHVGELKICAYS